MQRKADIERNTLETQIRVSLNLDGQGQSRFETGVHFLDHMLDQVARHGLVDLEIQAQGDLHIDAHHTVEDIGITLGKAFAQAVGDKRGIRPVMPMCRWTRRYRAWWWTSPAAQGWNFMPIFNTPPSAALRWISSMSFSRAL
jgi:hypothetical protein